MPAPALPDGGPAAAGDGPFRLLLVDDTDALRAVLERGLTRTGRFVVAGHACNGVEGIAAARDLRPDAVLLDLSMPVLDGQEALPQILAASPGTVVVILTGYEHVHLEQPLRQAGAAAFIEKGTTPMPQIAATLLRVLGAS